MLRFILSICFCLLPIAYCYCESNNSDDLKKTQQNLKSLRIKPDKVTVSGISSGAYMATQFHFAHSSIVEGVAMVAGGAYQCAQNSIQQALTTCMQGSLGNLQPILKYIEDYDKSGLIDPVSNIKNDKIWIFHGQNDKVMSENTSKNISELYKNFTTSQITEVYDIPANHGMPTINTGIACDNIASPFLNSCQYDAAGEILKFFYGPLENRTNATGDIVKINQSDYKDAFFLENGYLYIPQDCRNGSMCRLHISFHGCKQSSEFIELDFVNGAGYNEWAEANNIIIFYPQISSSLSNPNGCWDWWGYTDQNYSNQNGLQIRAVYEMIQRIKESAL